ncbi:hypothetical protein ACVW0I_004869 [Bradyrhizobium sp. LM6.11]
MLVNSRLSGAAAGIRLAHMRTHANTSGSEVLLGIIAIRLAVLVVVGWTLTLLPRQARESDAGCLSLTCNVERGSASGDDDRRARD